MSKDIPMFVATNCYDDNEVLYFNEGDNPLMAISEFSKHDYLRYCEDEGIPAGETVTVYVWTAIAFEDSAWADEMEWQEGQEKPFEWCLDELVRTATLTQEEGKITMNIPPKCDL